MLQVEIMLSRFTSPYGRVFLVKAGRGIPIDQV